jgi:signal transduction histidine kinase
MNLIRNSIKFSHREHAIDVILNSSEPFEESGRHVFEIQVIDEGCGIS